MKRNPGIVLLIIALTLSSIGALLKILKYPPLDDLFLAMGLILMIAAVVMILYKVYKLR